MNKFGTKIVLAAVLLLAIVSLSAAESSMLRLKMGEFSTDFEKPDFSSLNLSRESAKSEFEYYVVQFDTKVNPQIRKEIETAGGMIFDYIPDNAYIVKMNSKAFNAVKAKKNVKFMDIWQPAYRIAPNLVYESQQAFPEEKSGKIMMLASAFYGESSDDFKAALSSIPNVTVVEGYMPVRIEVPEQYARDAAVAIANLPNAYWVEREYPVVLHNAWSRWIMDTFDTLNMKAAADSWKSQLTMSSAADSARMQMYAHGIYGQNMIVGDDDTGCDWDNIYFRDPSGTKPVYDKDKDRICETTGTHRKIVAYNVIADTFDLSSSGHGSHTTGSVLADSMNSGLPSVTAFARVMGMAPLARLAFTDIGTTGDALTLPTNYADIYEWAYDAGARVHTSSWGQSSGGYSNYTTNCQQIDSCAWRHKDYIMFRSAGNSNTDRDSVNTPATAKNIVCVGATESGFGSGATTWAVNGTATRNELLDVAEFSSHGPTYEGMMRPDVCGTGGWYIWSVDSDGNLASNNAGIIYMGGTSMSTPTTAGFGALVRQYFTEGWYPSGAKNASDAITPSGALIKAMMINSTRNSPGAYSTSTINNTGTQSAPSQGQGWGRVTMADAIYFAGDTRDLRVWDATSGFTSAGQYTEYTVTTGPSTTEYIKVVLTWVDYPANTGVSSLVVNDLNLTVTINGNTYLGNVFGTSARSVTGGSADTENVTEVVWLDAVPNQTMTIRVTAANIPNGPQPYAVVATGDFAAGAVSGKIGYLKNAVQDTVSTGTVIRNSTLNNGEIADLDVWVKNVTGSNQNSITGKLRIKPATYVTMLDSTSTYGSISNNDSAKGDKYRVSISNTTPAAQALACTLFVSYSTKVDTTAFTLTVSGTKIASLSKDSLYYDYSASKGIKSGENVVTSGIFNLDRSGDVRKSILNVDLSESSPAKLVWDTLQWDDAANEGAVSWSGVGYFANKFTVTGACSLRAVQWGRYHERTETDSILVWSDNAGSPGTRLFTASTSVTTLNSAVIYRATLTGGPEVSGTFWVGCWIRDDNFGNNESYMLSDTIGGVNSYYAGASAGPWTNMNPNGDLIIRAEVESMSQPHDTGTIYVKNTNINSNQAFSISSITKAKNSAWIASVSPTSGTVNVGDSLGVSVFIDTTGAGLAPYTIYYDTLLIAASADTLKAITIRVPVTLFTGSMASTGTALSSMNAAVKQNDVILSWTTAYNREWIVSRNDKQIGFISGSGNMSFTDNDVPAGSYRYKLGMKISDNNIVWSNSIPVMIEKLVAGISKPYPNPFVTSSSFNFTSDADCEAHAAVYDISGREIKTLYSGTLKAGVHTFTWDGRDGHGMKTASGVYFVKVTASGRVYTERLTLVR